MTAGPILFASISRHGQLNSLLTIVGELVRRGADDLWFATNDDGRAAIEALGRVSFVSLGPPRSSAIGDWDHDTRGRATASRKLRGYGAFIANTFGTDSLSGQFERTLAQIDAIKPTLMVIDFLGIGMIDAAPLRGVPYVLSVPVPISALCPSRLPWSYPTPFSGLPRAMTPRQQVANVAFRLGRTAMTLRPAIVKPYLSYVRACRAAGVEHPAWAGGKYLAAATDILNYSVWGLEYPFPAAPTNLRMVGTVIPPLPQATGPDADELRAWLDARQSVAYVAFGTLSRLRASQVTAVVAATARLHPRHHVLWKLPTSQQTLLPATLPPNLRVVGWVPSQLDVLAHPNVRGFFTHGGGNSVHEALRLGTPLLVMPFWLDCYDLATRIQDAGAGLSMPSGPQPDPVEIAESLDRVLTAPDLRDRAAHWANALTDAGGVEAAATVIEQRRAGFS